MPRLDCLERRVGTEPSVYFRRIDAQGIREISEMFLFLDYNFAQDFAQRGFHLALNVGSKAGAFLHDFAAPLQCIQQRRLDVSITILVDFLFDHLNREEMLTVPLLLSGNGW